MIEQREIAVAATQASIPGYRVVQASLGVAKLRLNNRLEGTQFREGNLGGEVLDRAFPRFGGAGGGRIITADSGAVRINNAEADATNALELNRTGATGAGAALHVISGVSRFDGDVEVNRNLFLDEDTQALVGNQNNLALDNKVVHRFTADTNINITGLVAPTKKRSVIIIDVDTVDTITIENQSASSSAANRIITGTGGDLVMSPNDSLTLWYDLTTTRWRVIN